LLKRIELRNFEITSTGGGKSISVRSATALPSLAAELSDYPTPSKKMMHISTTYSNCYKLLSLEISESPPPVEVIPNLEIEHRWRIAQLIATMHHFFAGCGVVESSGS